MVKYEIWTEEPNLDFYRRGYSPVEDYTLAGMWPGVMVTGASGKRYHGMRGINEVGEGTARSNGFFLLNEYNLADFSPELYPEITIDQIEPYQYSESADAVHYIGENMRLDISVGSFDWYDAKGRFEIHVEHLGEACAFFIPEQEGIAKPIRYRSQFGKATGKVNGDPVEGYAFLDACYGPPGILYFNLPLIRKIEKQWSSWMVEYTDGEIYTGFAWKSRGDTGFRAGHLIRNGVSTVVTDARVFTTYDERGMVWKTRVEVGGEWFELEQDTVSDWPAHTFGRVVSTSRGKEIAKSWTFIEWMQDNIEELLERFLAGELKVHHAREVWIENECVVLPEHLR